jgi:large subunit ribosomal protein L15
MLTVGVAVIHSFSLEMAVVNLDHIQEWIDQGRIDPNHPITVRELAQSRCIHRIKDGVKLLARGGDGVVKQPIHVVVSRASASAIAAIEGAGGSVTTRFYTRSSIQRILRGQTHPYLSMAWSELSGPLVLSRSLLELASSVPTNPSDTTSPATEGSMTGGSVTRPPTSSVSGTLTEIRVMKAKGYIYRLPDPTNRRDIEYYRDAAHRGYLSHLVGPNEGPSLFFVPPAVRKSAAGVKKVKVLPENRLW